MAETSSNANRMAASPGPAEMIAWAAPPRRHQPLPDCAFLPVAGKPDQLVAVNVTLILPRGGHVGRHDAPRIPIRSRCRTRNSIGRDGNAAQPMVETYGCFFSILCWASSMAVASPAPSAIISRISDIGVG